MSVNVLPEKDEAGNIIQYVNVREESSDPAKQTGGHYQAQSFEIDIDATSGWKVKDASFPYPIALLSAEWRNITEYEGDELEVSMGPDTIVGAITADVSSGKDLTVQQSVLDNIDVGFQCSITDGTNTDTLGRVLSKDPDNMKISVETDVSNSFLAATPTYVRQTIIMIPRIMLPRSGTFELGGSKIGASFIPANTIIRMRYNNISATAKTFSIIMEYLY